MKTSTSQPEEYDLLVLGSGTAGKLISWTLAKQEMKTAVIERKCFVGPKNIEVPSADGVTRLLHGKRVVINTGTHATIDPTPGFREANPLTHVEALELDRVPEDLLVLGGGYVGIELAQAMRRFGSRVTVIDRNARLVHHEDQDISEAMRELFKDEGIEVVTSARITRVEGRSGETVNLRANREGSEIALEGTHLLVATGRTPNTGGIGLELAGVETTTRGYVKVNERLETTAPDVWAVGECAGSPQFTHISLANVPPASPPVSKEALGALIPAAGNTGAYEL